MRLHGEHPGAGRGLEHDVGRADASGDRRKVRERERRRELLEALRAVVATVLAFEVVGQRLQSEQLVLLIAEGLATQKE
jgi:hypothetical protein